MIRNFLIVLLFAALVIPSAGQSASFDAAHSAVLSRLQSMGQGFYSEQEWNAAMQDVDALVADAEARNDGQAIIRAAVIKAMVLGDMRRQYDDALAVLRQSLKRVKGMDGVDASPLYVKQAEVMAEAGRTKDIEALIAEYKAGPYYNPQPFAWSGGAQPNDPLLIARPNASGGNSIPLTIMQKALRRSWSAPGTIFPDAVLTDIYGRTFSLADLRGQVVIIDFFARGWKKWEDNLPFLQETWSRYNGRGFTIISICLESNAAGLESLRLPWPVVANAADLTQKLGIFGDSTNYLLDANGVILARDMSGSDIGFVVRQALGQ